MLWFNESSSPDTKVYKNLQVLHHAECQVRRPGVHQAGDSGQVDVRLQRSPYQ